MKKISQRKNKKTIILLFSFSIIIIAIAYGFIASAYSLWPYQTKETNPQTIERKSKDDKNASDPTYPSVKNNGEDKQSSDTSGPDKNTEKVSVQVGITSASTQGSQVEVRAFVSGTIEGDGTCVATFTKNSKVVTASSKAFIDVSTTQCEPIVIDSSKLGTGKWAISVAYQSDAHEGSSASVELNL